jgi:hypothetical protein
MSEAKTLSTGLIKLLEALGVIVIHVKSVRAPKAMAL